MKIVGRNLLGLYMCLPDDDDWNRCETKMDKILLTMKAGWYINPDNW